MIDKLKNMLRLQRLNQKDQRAVKIGLFAVIAIIVFSLSTGWVNSYRQRRESIKIAKTRLDSLFSSQAKRAGIYSIVPAFKFPKPQQQQKFLFREKLNEQLKKTGINTKPLQVIEASGARRSQGPKILTIKCVCEKCTLDKVLDFLAILKKNPYLLAIEEFNIKKLDPKKSKDFQFELVVSTYVK